MTSNASPCVLCVRAGFEPLHGIGGSGWGDLRDVGRRLLVGRMVGLDAIDTVGLEAEGLKCVKKGVDDKGCRNEMG